MNIPKVAVPPRTVNGRKSRLTPLQEIELWSWYLARREIGTNKTIARKLGVTPHAVETALHCLRMRERNRSKIQRTNHLRALATLPY